MMSLAILLAYSILAGQETTDQVSQTAQGGGDLRSVVQSPISSLISLPFKFTFDSGVANDRIVVNYYGSANPVASNDTAENRAMNRRVEVAVGGL